MSLEQPMKVTGMRVFYCLMLSAVLGSPAFGQGTDSGGRATLSDDEPSSGSGSATLSDSDTPPNSAEAMNSPGPMARPAGPTAFPNYGPSQPGMIGYELTENPFAATLGFDKRIGGLYGAEQGHTNIRGFMPFYLNSRDDMWFVDIRALIVDNGNGGLNLGTGYRTYLPELDRIFTVAGWLDVDDGHAETYSRLGLSFESIGRFIEYRANSYYVVGDDSHVLASGYEPSLSRFQQEFLILTRNDLVESAYGGVDLEVGGPTPLLGQYGLNGYLGYYYAHSGNDEDTHGVSFRLNEQFNEDITGGFEVTDDQVFGTNLQFTVAMTLPNGAPSRWLRPLPVRQRMGQSMDRRYRIVANTRNRLSPEAACNPADGNPYIFAHVDPDAATNGDGTFENPFNSIAGFNNLLGLNKARVDVVYVSPREDGTDTNLNTGVTLLNNQRLLSTTMPLRLTPSEDVNYNGILDLGEDLNDNGLIDSLNVDSLPVDPLSADGPHTILTCQGLFDIPGFEVGDRPVLSSQFTVGGNVVTLANNNEVSGFVINGENLGTVADPLNNGIVGTGITGFTVRHNVIENATEGVLIDHVGIATGIMANNHVFGAGNRSSNGITINHTAGILSLQAGNFPIVDVFAPLELIPTIADVGGEDVDGDGVLDPTEDLNGNLMLDPGEDINGNGQLDFAEDKNGNGILDIGIAFGVNATGAGALVVADDAFGDPELGFFNHRFMSTPGDAMLGIPARGGNGAGLSLTATGGATILADVTENILSDTTDPAGFGFNAIADGSTISLNEFSLNTAIRNEGYGANLEARALGLINILEPSVTNIFGENGLDGMSIVADNSTVNFLRTTTDGISTISFQSSVFGGVANARPLLEPQYFDVVLDALIPRFDATDPTSPSPIFGNLENGLELRTETNGLITAVDLLNPTNNKVTLIGSSFDFNGDNGLAVYANSGTINVQAGALIADAEDGTQIFANTFNFNGQSVAALSGSGIYMGTTLNGTINTAVIDNQIIGNSYVFPRNEDGDRDGVLDTEDTNGNDVLDLLEDTNGNGILDTEDDNLDDILNTEPLMLGFRYTRTPVDLTPGNGITFDLDSGEVNVMGGIISNDLERDAFTDATDPNLPIVIQSVGNAGNGLSISASNGATFRTPTVADNDFGNQGRASMFIGGDGGPPDSIVDLTSVTRNSFDRDLFGTEGIRFQTRDVVFNGIFSRNSFIGRVPGAGRGIGGTVTGGGVTMVLGSDNVNDTNIFQDNGEAHIGLILDGDSVNSIFIDNHTFNNAVDANGPVDLVDFNGDGVAYIVRDTATLTGFIRRSEISENDGDGIHILVSGGAIGSFAQVNNFTIGGATADLGNQIFNNGQSPSNNPVTFRLIDLVGNGISIGRIGSGIVNGMTIQHNFVGNVDVDGDGSIDLDQIDGIAISAYNADILDTYEINDNIIAGNTTDGVHYEVGAEGKILSNMRRNMIFNNGLNGILVSEQPLSATDTRAILGTWQENIIVDNGQVDLDGDGAPDIVGSGDGIDLSGVTSGLLIGSTISPTLGNLIAGNTANGIDVNNAGTLTIAGNLITDNGTLRTLGSARPGGGTVLTQGDQVQHAGIDINALPFSQITIVGNDITDNRGDAVEYRTNPGALGTYILLVDGNTMDFNDGRGVDILNAGDTRATIDIVNNFINVNDLEGIYIVNSASGGQRQDVDSREAMIRTASVSAAFNPRLLMTIDNNEIVGNGKEMTLSGSYVDGLDATGLVVRVGTSTGSTATGSFSDPGDFATPPNGLFGPGGIVMTVSNNALVGNFGNDVLFQSFTSTVDPQTSAGTWDQNTFNVTAFDRDALARLDLAWLNNTFNAGDFNNSAGTFTGSQDFAAFYNNPEPVFKSRLNNIQAPNIAGPFQSATRRRNAQRLADRVYPDGTFLPPNPAGSPDNGVFLFDGMGDSTFRIDTANSDPLLSLIAQGFAFDDVGGDFSPIENVGEANGVFLINTTGDDMPYGWGTF